MSICGIGLYRITASPLTASPLIFIINLALTNCTLSTNFLY